MLRANLSTRPFYNERLVNLALMSLAVLAVVLAVVNVWQLVSLSSERRTLAAAIARDRSEAEALRQSAVTRQQAVDRFNHTELAAGTTEANALIDQRTFSWTVFFGLIERTLPDDVRLVMVSPRIDRGVLKVGMTVIARDLSDIDAFLDALRESGSFRNPEPVDQQARDDGTFTATIEAAYGVKGGASAEAPAKGAAE